VASDAGNTGAVEEEYIRPVVHTPDTCSGSPRLENTRLTCNNIVRAIAHEGAMEMLKTYGWPLFNEQTLTGCVAYCAERRCIGDRPKNFCQHCLLDVRRLEDSESDDSAAIWRIANEILRRGVMTPGEVDSERMQAVEDAWECDNGEVRAIWHELGMLSRTES
jgi:uncharacterized protein (DUF433 family)